MAPPDLSIEAREAARSRAKLDLCHVLEANRTIPLDELAAECIEHLWAAGWRPVGRLPDEHRTDPHHGPRAARPPPAAQAALEAARQQAREHTARILALEAHPMTEDPTP